MLISPLADARLYGILDLGYVDPTPESVEAMADQMLEGGVRILQLRAKHFPLEALPALAKPLAALCRQAEVPLIINDYPELAREVGAAGVHVGQDDLEVNIARARASVPHGLHALVGKSTHSVEQAIAGARDGADYIGFGPLFATPTKPDYTPIGIEEIRYVHEILTLPIFCIGGIKLENLEQVIAAGAKRVVIVSGILQAPDVVAYCEEALAMLEDLAPL